MIVIIPSNGDGGVTEEGGASVLLYDAAWEAQGVAPIYDEAYFELQSGGAAVGEYVSTSGPDGWTWLVSGTNSDLEVKCQVTTGNVDKGASDATNSWLNLGTTRTWVQRRKDSETVLSITIRDVATQTTQATCTITFNAI